MSIILNLKFYISVLVFIPFKNMSSALFSVSVVWVSFL